MLLFAVVVLGLGAIGLSAVPGSFRGLPDAQNSSRLPDATPLSMEARNYYLGIMDGSWRAAYEREFDDSLAIAQGLRTLWHRLTYLLFARTLPGVEIGKYDYLFTTEEWYENRQDFKFLPDVLHDNSPLVSIPAKSGAAAASIPDGLIDAGSQAFLASDFLSAAVSVSESLGAMGIQLIVVLVPAKNRILGAFTTLRLSDRLLARYQTALEQLSTAGIPAVDLETAFNKHPKKERLYMRTDTHWSPEGARTAAQVIADFIVEHGLNGNNAKVEFESHASMTEPFQGDLFEFLPRPDNSSTVAPRIGIGLLSRALPEKETIIRYSTVPIAEGSVPAGLFDTPRIPVALTGTSYSAGADWNFAGFLMEAMQTDLVNLARAGVGPFEPMATVIGDPILQELGVGLVLWEIPERYLVP